MGHQRIFLGDTIQSSPHVFNETVPNHSLLYVCTACGSMATHLYLYHSSVPIIMLLYAACLVSLILL